jgi:hypothetical protein
MTLVTWRNTALALAVVCGCQRWQSCSRGAAPAEPATPELRPARETPATPTTATTAPLPGEPAATPGKTLHGFKIPAWAMRLAPQRGETLRAYRDRILPVAELAVAPQRARVARLRVDFAQLDPRQRAELDAAVADAARAIEDRVRTALASGELAPATFKPMTGIAVARDVLAIVDRGNTRFLGSLTPDQRTRLASHRFDFADYLAFSARWEDALHALDR